MITGLWQGREPLYFPAVFLVKDGWGFEEWPIVSCD